MGVVLLLPLVVVSRIRINQSLGPVDGGTPLLKECLIQRHLRLPNTYDFLRIVWGRFK